MLTDHSKERLLSPRMLFFSVHELFWHCKEKVACESFPERLPENLTEDGNKQWNEPLYKNWHRIIQLYSGAELTYGKDKLVALSGIAKATKDEIAKSELDDEYLVGMWRRDLEMRLCWRTCANKPRVYPYRAPSWSWMSVDGPIEMFRIGIESQIIVQYAHVIDARVITAGPDPFGQVEGGVLKLGVKYMLPGKTKRDDSMDIRPRLDVIVTLSGGEILFQTWSDTLMDPQEADEVYMIPIAEIALSSKYKYGINMTGQTTSVYGIVVRPAMFEEGQYVRVGSFDLITGHFGQLVGEYDNFLRAIEEVGTETARRGCTEAVTSPEEIFVINVV